MCVMAADAEDPRIRLGQLVAERRRAISLSVSAAARSAGIDRGTWTGVERGTRETEEYNYSRIERVLNWRPGSVDQILYGGDPVPANATAENGNGNGPATEAAVDPDRVDQEIALIQRSTLPMHIKRAMIQEAERLRDRQRQEREAIASQLAEQQAAERREQVQTWLKLAGGNGPQTSP